MKWIMVMGAVLALSPVAFGAASFSLTESGGSATAVNAQAGTTISVDLHMTAASTVKVFSLGLLGSTSGIFDVSARTWDAALGAPDDDINFVGSALDSPTANAGALREVGKPFPAGPSVLETIDLDIDSGATLNTKYTISMVAPGTGGNIYVSYEDGTSGDSAPGVDACALGDVTLSTYDVTIVPEPASMLLLAGALPFLRRRRSA